MVDLHFNQLNLTQQEEEWLRSLKDEMANFDIHIEDLKLVASTMVKKILRYHLYNIGITSDIMLAIEFHYCSPVLSFIGYSDTWSGNHKQWLLKLHRQIIQKYGEDYKSEFIIQLHSLLGVSSVDKSLPNYLIWKFHFHH